MRIDVYHHIDPVEAGKTDLILSLLRQIIAQNKTERDLIVADFTQLQAAVAQDGTVEAGVITLLTGLSQQIADLKSASTDPATQAAIDALTAEITAKSQTLADALLANTPAAVTPSAPA